MRASSPVSSHTGQTRAKGLLLLMLLASKQILITSILDSCESLVLTTRADPGQLLSLRAVDKIQQELLTLR